ncbi:hypothetical protein Z043_104579 [Scleropages formosus]|uniref:Protein AF-10-like n=1 Tax=Scleropages formosus TaxID=113540 RepID=A0A0N8K1W9_SCLFO|nr:hypothetical protein Z043_104579 [Scleropages formosus]
MVSSEPSLAVEDDYIANNMKEMIGGCCVCSDERGWAENPLVYCDGHGCNVAVHQACYGIVQVPTGPWFCRKCESQERAARVRCELCPHKDGALKRTDNGGWAHVVCALYIPEVEFANVSTMEPIVLQSVPHERYNKGRESKAATGACMTCNKHGCRQAFHVTCAQFAGLLCEEQGSDADNVKYCGYCKYHYSKLRRSKGRGSRAQSLSDSSSHSLDKHHDKDKKKHKERDKHKPRHKKSLESSPALTPALTVTTEKEVPTHAGGATKDGVPAEGKGASDSKSKKVGSHSSGQRGRKSTPGKPSLPVVITSAPASSATSTTSPFQQGLLLGSSSSNKTSSSTSGVQAATEFLSFSETDLRNDSYQQSPFGCSLAKSASDSGATESLPPPSFFESLIAQASSSVSSGGKSYENSHSTGDMRGLTSAGHKRPQPSSSSGRGATGQSEEGAGKGKKRRGKWRNRYGPCWAHDTVKGTELTSSSTPAPSASPAALVSGCSNAGTLGGTGSSSSIIMGGGSSGGIQRSPSLLRNGSLQSHNVSSSPARPGRLSPHGVLLFSYQ